MVISNLSGNGWASWGASWVAERYDRMEADMLSALTSHQKGCPPRGTQNLSTQAKAKPMWASQGPHPRGCYLFSRQQRRRAALKLPWRSGHVILPCGFLSPPAGLPSPLPFRFLHQRCFLAPPETGPNLFLAHTAGLPCLLHEGASTDTVPISSCLERG